MRKRNGKRQSQINQRNNFEFLNQNHISLQNNSKKQSRGSSTIKSVLQDSLNKFSSSETFSNTLRIVSSQQLERKIKNKKIFKNKGHCKRNKNKISINPTNYTIKEPTRVLYSDLDEAEKIMKHSNWNADSGMSVTENSIISSVSLIPVFQERYYEKWGWKDWIY